MGGNKQKTGMLVSCWILLVLVLLICYFVWGDRLKANLRPIYEAAGKPIPEWVKKSEERRKEKEISEEEKKSQLTEADKNKKDNSSGKKDDSVVTIEITPGPGDKGPVTEEIVQNTPSEENTVAEIKVEKQPEEKPKAEEKVPEQKKEESKPVAKSKVTLCFVNVNADGKVVRKITTREIPKSNAPLTNTIKALLTGPEASDKNCISLIPQGTKLLGASVKNGIATLNFSEEFEFNGISADGYRAQLMQIVYTATEFSTVDSVQFLIEGQRKEYMGSEEFQIWIGSPYSRSSFQ